MRCSPALARSPLVSQVSPPLRCEHIERSWSVTAFEPALSCVSALARCGVLRWKMRAVRATVGHSPCPALTHSRTNPRGMRGRESGTELRRKRRCSRGSNSGERPARALGALARPHRRVVVVTCCLSALSRLTPPPGSVVFGEPNTPRPEVPLRNFAGRSTLIPHGLMSPSPLTSVVHPARAPYPRISLPACCSNHPKTIVPPRDRKIPSSIERHRLWREPQTVPRRARERTPRGTGVSDIDRRLVSAPARMVTHPAARSSPASLPRANT